MALVEILDEPRVGGLPSQQPTRQRAGGWAVGREEPGEPAEVLSRVIRRDGGYGEIEMASDHLGHLADRDAILGDRVQD